MKSPAAMPQVVVAIGGSPLDDKAFGALEEIRVRHRLSLPAQCELVFVNPQGALAGGGSVPAGQELRVSVSGSNDPLFVGEITAAEHHYEPAHGHELRLRGYDALHRLRKRQPVRAHVQTTVRELATELVAGLDLTVEASEEGPLLERLVQYRESDLELLTEVVERCGLFFSVRGNVLSLMTLEGSGEPVELALGDTLLEARIEMNGEPACRTVVTSAWDPSRVEHHEGRATAARVGREISAAVPPSSFGVDGERTLAAEVARTDGQATAIAQAELDRRVAREVTFWGVAEGDPRLSPGRRVAVSGVAAACAGTYVLTAVDHHIDRKTGFVSEISTAPPQPRARSRSASAALGVVTRVEDPDSLGRVRVSLPAYCDLETDWMSVISTGAGGGKGFLMQPDVGDQVLVLLTQDDPAHGVVLGGLYGAKNPPESFLEAGAVRRFSLLTPGGQKVLIDDTQKRIRLENKDGSYLEIAPERVVVHATTQIQIEAIGQPVLIRGKAINFEET